MVCQGMIYVGYETNCFCLIFRFRSADGLATSKKPQKKGFHIGKTNDMIERVTTVAIFKMDCIAFTLIVPSLRHQFAEKCIF